MRAISHIRRTPTTTQFGSGGHLEVTVLAATLSYTAPPPSSAMVLREGSGEAEAETKTMELDGELEASIPNPSASHPHQQPHKLLRECLVRVDLRAWDSAGGAQAGGQVRNGRANLDLRRNIRS